MNWGTKLVIGLGTFMTFIVVLGVLMIRSKDDALVDNDYYEKGIHYNEDYNKKENVKNDHAEPTIEVVNDVLIIIFTEYAKGTVKLIRISDQKMDKTIDFETDQTKQLHIPVGGKARGLWKIKLNWKNNFKFYLYEREVTL